MRPQSCTVCGPLALVLRIMRVLSLAPLTIARERAGYRIRVCKRYAYVGYFGAILLIILNGAYIWIDMKIKKENTIITVKLPILFILKMLDVWLGTLISVLGVLFSVTRMNNVIEQVYYMEQEIPANRRKQVNNRNKRLILFLIMSRVFLELIQFIRDLFSLDLEIVIYSYFFSRIEYVLVCAVQIYLFAIYEEILAKIRIVREQLQDLTDSLEFEYIPSSEPITETANIRLQVISEKMEFLKETFQKMNQSNKYTAFCIYIVVFSRFIQSMFDASRIIRPEDLVVSIVFRIIFVLHHTFGLVLFVEPFHGIELEMQTIKLQVCRIATTDYVTDSIPVPLEMLYDELSTMDMTFSPLGVFTMRRSLLTKALGAAISYLAIVIQFKVD